MLAARILAVSNAFVALLSPRAYRAPVNIDQALEALLHDSDSRYDRRVVAALLVYYNNLFLATPI